MLVFETKKTSDFRCRGSTHFVNAVEVFNSDHFVLGESQIYLCLVQILIRYTVSPRLKVDL